DGKSTGGIFWNARVLSSHGAGTEEAEFGGDLLGVLRISFPDYRVVKGFLAQAKKQKAGSKLPTDEWNRLQHQCERMLRVTPESYVFVYSLDGVHMVPAIAVTACTKREDLHALHPITTGRFYAEHFRCFIGDRRLDAAAPTTLESLRYKTGIEISAESKGQTS